MSMNELMNALKAFRFVSVKHEQVVEFVEYCRDNDIYPLFSNVNESYVWLYI